MDEGESHAQALRREVSEECGATLTRIGLVKMIGEENFFWSSDQAIVEAEKRGFKFCSL